MQQQQIPQQEHHWQQQHQQQLAARAAPAPAPASAPASAPPDRPRRLLAKLEAAGAGLEEGAEGEEGGRWPWLGSDRRDAQGRRPGEAGYDPSTLHVPAAALAAMSEFNKQFWGIKSRCMDLVLFVRHGRRARARARAQSFYNLFDVDCDLGMRVGLNLSGRRVPNMYKCGCTKDAFATWAAKVLALGYSVGRVEEMPRGAQGGRAAGQKLLERRLVRIYTPGTAVDGLLADDLGQDARPFMCVVEAPAGGAAGAAALGCCIVDVASGQAHAGSFRERSAARPALCTALLRFDPVEVVCCRGALSPPTLAALGAHCRPAGGAGAGAVLVQLAPGLGCAGAAEARQLLSAALPPAALRALAELGGAGGQEQQWEGQQEAQQQQQHRDGSGGGSGSLGGLDGLGAQALALAVRQLQRCGLAGELLPTLLVAPLEVEGAAGFAVGGARAPGAPQPPRRQHMLLDDAALSALDVLQGPLGGRRGSLLAALDRTASAAGRRRLRHWLCRPLAVTSLIEERLSVVDLFREYPTFASALQSALRRLPDAERLLPRAARALGALLQGGGGGGGGSGGAGAGGAEEGAGSQDAWVGGGAAGGGAEGAAEWRRADQWQQRGQGQGGGGARDGAGGARGRQPAWRAMLQARQQQTGQQAGGQQWGDGGAAAPAARGAPGAGSGGAPSDPADGAWAADAQQAAWRAVRQLPPALSGMVEAVAVLRRCMGELGLSSSKLPLVQKAVVAAARCAGAVDEIAALLAGSEWPRPEPGGGGGGGGALGGLRLERGADAAYDAASDALAGAEARLEAAAAAALSAFGGAAAPREGGGGGQKGRPKGKQQAAAAAATAAALADVAQGLLQVPASYGASLQGPDFEFAGHGPTPATILVRCPELARLAAARAAAAAARAAAAAAALGGAAAKLLGSYGPLAALVAAVADLDVLAGFAAVSEGAPPGAAFCRPAFAAAAAAGGGGGGQTPPLHFRGLWHPLLLAAGAGAPPRVQPNDLLLGGGLPGALLLTGANTSGKSTLLRGACVAAICAQVGCYAPAAEALISPVDGVFTRMGAQDRIMLGQSTFAVEMAEAALAMAAATPSSLLVMDELGRGTSTFDGCALAYAVLDHLTQGGGAGPDAAAAARPPPPRVLFATHYHRLARETALAGRMQLAHMKSELVSCRAAAPPPGGGAGGPPAPAGARGGWRRRPPPAGAGGAPGAGTWFDGGGAAAAGAAALGRLEPLELQGGGAAGGAAPGQLALHNTFELRPGAAPNGSCGIDVAAVAGLPAGVVERARAVAAAMEGDCGEAHSGGGDSGGPRAQDYSRQDGRPLQGGWAQGAPPGMGPAGGGALAAPSMGGGPARACAMGLQDGAAAWQQDEGFCNDDEW
ncbi:MAG: muts domain V-domain-containing protein [Monoraphidium minutum]|nr:MAG: muts domain V-domain-containing protein [Monoraphidium minutum]